jgi:pimeloyl-ACP methyl ester carboxylesterase
MNGMAELTTQYLDLGELKIAYREHGAGPVLILLHGNSASKGFFSKYQTVHFKMFRTIALDSRGHGETRSDDPHYSISQYSDDVIALCKAMGITQAGVIGHSDGGNIALFLAYKAPEIFKKIVAISPNYLVSGTTDGTLKFLKTTAKLLQALEKLGLPTHKAVLRYDLMLTDIGITAEELGGIQTSLRILYAEHDMVKEEHVLEMRGLIPGATVKKIGRSNHLTILYKQETIEDMREYLLGA